MYMFGHPALVRRASAVVTDVGRGAVDAAVAKDERDGSVRQSRVVLTPRLLASSSKEANASEG